MNHLKIIATYAITGPILGGLVVTIAVLIEAPHLGGHAAQLLATAVMFAFPFGGVAAFSTGVTHALLADRVKSIMLIVIAVALAGVVAQAVQLLAFDGLRQILSAVDGFLMVVGAPVASAVPISLFLLWRSGRMWQRVTTDGSRVDAA